VPSSCPEDTPCPLNFECKTGKCVRRACMSSSECHGYCVLNTCQELPGHCADTCLP
jgi:hypothetical protein